MRLQVERLLLAVWMVVGVAGLLAAEEPVTLATTVPAATRRAQVVIALAGDSTVTDKVGWGVGFAHSIQGDAQFAKTLSAMGADVEAGRDWIEVRGKPPLRAIDADFVRMPDAAMTAAVAALFADGTSRLRGIGSWRVKETDRIAAMATELTKLGARVEAGLDWLSIVPPSRLVPATIDTYDDHRIAMCLSLASLGGITVRINDPQCVRKTFPDYFAAFRGLAR